LVNNPLVSIIIPTFNSEKYIRDTLNSVQNQIYKNWECILVDDLSTDTTVEIITEYTNFDFRFKFYLREKDPKGAPNCRNIGIERSSGVYVIFLDSDDILENFCLEVRVQKMIEYPKLDFGVFPTLQFFENKNISTPFTQLTKKHIFYCVIATDNIWQTMGAIYKKKALTSVSGFSLNFPRFQDDDFHFRILLNKKIKYKLFDTVKFDCYYRILDRKNNQKYNEDGVYSLIMYITNIIESISNFKFNKRLFRLALKAVLFKLVIYNILSISSSSRPIYSLFDKLLEKSFIKKRDLVMHYKYMNEFESRKPELLISFDNFTRECWTVYSSMNESIQRPLIKDYIRNILKKMDLI